MVVDGIDQRSFRRGVVVGAGLVLAVVFAVVAWRGLATPTTTRWCTLNAAVDPGSRADTAQGAFDEWWMAQGGPFEWVSSTSGDGGSYTAGGADAFHRRSKSADHASWVWSFTPGREVEVSATRDQGGWSVTDVHECRIGQG